MLRSRLGPHSLVCGAEVDWLDLSAPGDASAMSSFVELKTSREVESRRQQTTMQKFKMLKWWAQSFLVGIGKVVVGFRDEEGLLHRQHAYGTSQLAREQQFWSPPVCMNFAAASLAYCTRRVTGGGPAAVWRVAFCPAVRRVTCTLLDRADGGRRRLLPDWIHGSAVRRCRRRRLLGTAAAENGSC